MPSRYDTYSWMPERSAGGSALSERALPQVRGLLILCLWPRERSPSCSVRTAPDGTIGVRCFGCGVTGDVFHLVAVAHALDVQRDLPEVLDLATELASTRRVMSPASPRLMPAAGE
jgi:hypothetical protein